MPILKNPQHEKFAQAVAQGASYSKAYIEAGYEPDGGHASRLAANGTIGARVREILQIGADKASMSAADVIREIEKVASANIALAALWDAETLTLKPSLALPPEITAAISEIRQTKDGVVLKFHNKSAALEQLAKYHKLYRAESEINLTMSLGDLVMASYKPGDPHSPHERKSED